MTNKIFSHTSNSTLTSIGISKPPCIRSQKLKSLNIELVAVPSNMTHFFQPLDLTVNGVAKSYMRKQFVTYYSNCVKQQLESGKRLEDVEVDFRLTSQY